MWRYRLKKAPSMALVAATLSSLLGVTSAVSGTVSLCTEAELDSMPGSCVECRAFDDRSPTCIACTADDSGATRYPTPSNGCQPVPLPTSTPCQSGCAKCDAGQTTCYECDSTHSLDVSDGTCVADPHIADCSAHGCTGCTQEDGSTVIQCVTCGDDPANAKASDGHCDACGVANPGCKVCVPSTVEETFTCAICEASTPFYNPDNGVIACSDTYIPGTTVNCVDGSNDPPVCHSCDTADRFYVMGADGVCGLCSTLIPGCLFCDGRKKVGDPDACSACGADTPFFNPDENGNYVCSATYTDGETINCEDGASAPTPSCSSCADGYLQPQPPLCVSCSYFDSNCALCGYPNDQFQCTTCADGFVMGDSLRCVPCSTIPSCATCDPAKALGDAAACKECSTNTYYFQDSGASTYACGACNAAVANCEECDPSSPPSTATCAKCATGYVRDGNGACVPCSTIADCVECDPAKVVGEGGACTNCTAGYSVTSAGGCGADSPTPTGGSGTATSFVQSSCPNIAASSAYADVVADPNSFCCTVATQAASGAVSRSFCGNGVADTPSGLAFCTVGRMSCCANVTGGTNVYLGARCPIDEGSRDAAGGVRTLMTLVVCGAVSVLAAALV